MVPASQLSQWWSEELSMLAADLSPCAAQSCLVSLAQPLLWISTATHVGLMERMRILWVWLL